MKAVPLWKILLFIFIVLPVFLFLFVVFFIPLILILLFVMPVMGKQFAFRAKNFGKGYFHRGEEEEDTATRYDAGKEEGEIVDVEGIEVEPEKEEPKDPPRKLLPPE